ncbi:MAG: TIGR00266 family protein [Treponema sp.]|nr:TIGR00266 family protein [Treponema sp.]
MRYTIQGNPFPVVICEILNREQVVCQPGAMLWMSRTMRMGTDTGGGIGKMFSRALSQESLFQNTYTAEGGEGTIAFGMRLPGTIIPLDVERQPIIAQKGAFLAAEKTVNMDIAFQKKLGAGFFGGEGFLLQRFSGFGTVFLEIEGSIVQQNLKAGEQLLIDTGAFAFAEASVSVDVEMVKGVGNILAGGEGLFHTIVSGPGKLWLQTLPLKTFIQSIVPSLRQFFQR